MSNQELVKRLEALKIQQEQTKELFIKCQGAIELLEQMIKEDEKSAEKDKSNAKKKV